MLQQLETACSILESIHAEMLKIIEEVSVEGMNWIPPLKDVNSIYAIATHSIASQLWWIKENLHGQKVERDRPAEFTAQDQNLGRLINSVKEVQALTREILETIQPEDLQEFRLVKEKPYTVEWIVLHVIEHTATHLGHMQLTEQMWKGKSIIL
jgi:uncharacterized damage-inducible protein DinB